MKTYPDYGTSPEYVPSVLLDVGESAARINGLSQINRTGRVVYWDIIASINPWTRTAAAVNTGSYVGVNCMRLTPAGATASIYKYLPPFYNTNWGVEFYFRITGALVDFTVVFQQGYSAPFDYRWNMTYTVGLDSLMFEGYSVGTLGLFLTNSWNHMKIVYSDRNYVIVNGFGYEINRNPVTIAATGRRLTVGFLATGAAGTFDVDNIIYTVDEPSTMPG